MICIITTLTDSIRYLKGVGEKRASLYQKLDIHTPADLLYHFPRGYIDLRRCEQVATAPLGQLCALRLTLLSKSSEQRIRGGLSLWKLTATDDTDDLHITYFNAKYTVSNLKIGQEYIFYGKLTGTLLRREMASPQIFSPDQNALIPLYPLTSGLSQNSLRKDITTVLPMAHDHPDPLPEHLLEQYNLPPLGEALVHIHNPHDMDSMTLARRRFAFEELFSLALGFAMLKASKNSLTATPMLQLSLQPFFDALPFKPTSAQRRAIDQAVDDMCKPRPMNRLVQGDVGSGKTLVAAACCWYATQNSTQSALMAPTELLAGQHYRTLSSLLTPLGVRVGLLTGSLTAKAKKELYAKLQQGEIDLCIGTHALISPAVVWHNLSLVVTDEQHRFGVRQRAALREKGKSAHMLVMSATPIPRTLSLMIYGDLDLSVIDELPPGRTPIETLIIDSPKRTRAFGFIRGYLDRGFQAYLVCPLIEQGEQTPEGMMSAEDYAQDIVLPAFEGYPVELLHGRMKSGEKEAVMSRFVSGETKLLVSTTVIEVGVDVPSAVIMLVENAERFGLSQLHQLRGRVGRGREKSWCILVSDSTTDQAVERLSVMRQTSDGFVIAKEDLRLRGPGDFFGNRQHGLPNMHLADLSGDMELFEQAGQAAHNLLFDDPLLENYPALAAQVERLIQAVGELPN